MAGANTMIESMNEARLNNVGVTVQLTEATHSGAIRPMLAFGGAGPVTDADAAITGLRPILLAFGQFRPLQKSAQCP